MLTAILLTILLAQADDFVEFRICELDYQAHPWEFRPARNGGTAYVRPAAVWGLNSAEVRIGGPTAGIDCTLIYTQRGTFFVVGSVESVRERLK